MEEICSLRTVPECSRRSFSGWFDFYNGPDYTENMKEQKHKQKKKKSAADLLVLLAVLVCLAVMGISGFRLFRIWQTYHAGDAEYSALEAYTRPTSGNGPSAPAAQNSPAALSADQAEAEEQEILFPAVEPPLEVDFDALHKMNPDVIGWFYFGSLELSYPLVQGKDNDYYLNHTFNGSYNPVGAIFLDAYASPDMSDPNCLVYGHRMKNKSMMGKLNWLETHDLYREDPYFWIITPEGSFRYAVFSLHETSSTGETYTLYPEGSSEFLTWVKHQKDDSNIDMGDFEFNSKSHIVTLSTCTTDSAIRYVVQGVRVQR